MPADTPSMQVGSAAGKIRLLSLHDLDRRTAAYRRTIELIGAIERDLGGDEQLSTGKKQLVRRIALSCAISEHLEARWLSGEEIDPTVYSALANSQKRLLEVVGLQRVPRDVTPSLEQYLAVKARATEPAR